MVVGVDPGAEYTGVVAACTGDRTGELVLRAHRTVKRQRTRGFLPVEETYFDAVQTAVMSMLIPSNGERVVVGVEMVHPPVFAPSAKLGMIDPAPLIVAAIVAGYTLAYWRDRADAVYQVEPGGNGHGPYVSYPDGLVTAQERRGDWQRRQAGEGQMRHERSAWDVARWAEQMDRLHRRQG